jgi:signal transduction histidine kinase
MTLETLPYLMIYIVALTATGAVAVFTWLRRANVPGATAYAVAAGASTLWTAGYILELITADESGKIFWDNVQFLASLLVVAGVLIFALLFVRRDERGGWRLWLWHLPGIAFFTVLAFTDGQHGLMRANTQIITGDPLDAMIYDFTPMFYVYVAYLYVVIFASLWYLWKAYQHTRSIYRTQITFIMAGTMISVIGGGLTVAGLTLAGQRDLAPIYFALSNLIIAVGLFRFHLFELAPIARDVVFDNLSAVVIVIDLADRVVDANPFGQRLARYPDRGVVGHKLEENYPLVSEATAEMRRQKQPGRVQIQTAEIEDERYFDISLTPVQNRHGQHAGFVLIAYEVSVQVRTANTLRDRTEALEAANDELKVAWDAARQADEVKSQFLASMSHELRTPLNAILNFTEFMKLGMLGPVNERQLDALTKTHESGRHLLALINDVLDMTRIEAGMMRLFVERDVDLTPEIDAVVATTRSLLADKPVNLVLDIDAVVPRVTGDRRRIRQILLNLLANATKFTDTGTITFSVKPRGDNVTFAVIDTGPGIALEEQAAIFEPFRQAEKGIQQANSTGLGLPISRRLADAHFGQLWVESESGEGAAFYLRLPVASPELIAMLDA